MKQISLLLVALVCLLAPFAASAETTPAPAAPAVTDIRYAECPIMGGKALPDVATIHENKVYHFCCLACIDTFKKDPAAAIAKIKDSKEVALNVTNPDGKCPVCGKVSGTEFFKISGDSITFYFCKDCVGKEATKNESSSASTPAAAVTATPASAETPSQTAAPSATGESAPEADACGDCSSCGGCPSAGN